MRCRFFTSSQSVRTFISLRLVAIPLSNIHSVK
nr:MAG TPA: hypothetical protein [Caudoviricetes sp.]